MSKTITISALEVSREIYNEERRDGEPVAYAVLTALASAVDWNAGFIIGLRQKRRRGEPLIGAEIQELVALGRLYGLIRNKTCN